MLTKLRTSICAIALPILCIMVGSNRLNATTVRFTTSVGSFDVALFDETAPITVANFLDYVNSGSYENSIVHRSVPSFVIQGGGYKDDFSEIPTNDPIVNESGVSNTRGTIAMARTQDPDSARIQWFVNVVDNDFLDQQTGGFAVFGEVAGDGMSVVSSINDLRRTNAGSPFNELPVLDSSLGISADNLVVIQSVSIVPEPSAISLAMFAMLVLIGRSRRWAI